MKIYVFGTRGFPDIQGGVEKHCEALYTRFPKEYQITVFRRKPYVLRTPIYPHIRFKDICSTKIKGFEALFHSLICSLICICQRPDIVHIHNIGPGCFVPLLRLVGLKVVLTYHSANYEHKKWGQLSKVLLKMAEAIALRFSNSIVFVNRFRLEMQQPDIREKAVYIPNGINPLQRAKSRDYVSLLGLIPEKYILAVGRITPEKGFDDLIDAFNRLEANRNYKLVIAGGVEYETTYLEYLKKKSNSENIVYTGFLTGSYLEELYTHAGLFVLPSHNEGFPLVVLEAMQLGCDVLLSDIPATRLLELSEEYYYPMGSILDLSEQIEKRIFSSGKHRHSYDLAAYDWGEICQKTQNIYNSLVYTI